MAMSSPGSQRQPRYAVAVLQDGVVVSRQSNVSKRRLLKMICDLNPSVLAVDNIYELASSSRKLIRFLCLFPSETKIIQVTGSFSNGLTSISVLAREYGFFRGGKLNPLKAAEFSARLAFLGVGSELMFMRDETRIIITRMKRPGEGGMSEDRYERKVKTAVYNVAKEIKAILDSNHLDYDVFYSKSKFGLRRCLFVVYSPKRLLRELIKPMRSYEVKVLIKGVYNKKLVFKPLRQGTPYSKSTKNYLICLLYTSPSPRDS